MKKVMGIKRSLVIVSAMVFIMAGCSKKQQPQGATADDTKIENTANKPAEAKKGIKKVSKMPAAKIITVDDRAARKTPDGRLYYDLDGKRYWKNYNDGKYYLFNRDMYNDPAFKPH